jgi:hypothetical protein
MPIVMDCGAFIHAWFVIVALSLLSTGIDQRDADRF